MQVYAGDLLVAVDYPVTISAGAFQTRPLLERGKPFTAASYRVLIRSTFEKRWQPPAVLLVVGGLGERLRLPSCAGPNGLPGPRWTLRRNSSWNRRFLIPTQTQC